VPSHEFSGEIAEIGEGVTRLSTGQQVYGMNDWFEDGALAEYCITRPDWIAPKPSRLTHAEFASVPIGALTAWQGLFDRAKFLPGERVLIQGGAGAVGLFAVQFARSRGAYVIATASEHKLDF
jgi:NADPH:quinone reductase-like Zn-dependent oxidoreductase